MAQAKIKEWDDAKALKYFQSVAALAMEGLMMEAWSDARQNHMFLNRKGYLEASIRVEKKKLGNGWVAYRLAAGVGGITGKYGWEPYPKGRPGGVRSSTVTGLTYDPKIPYYAPFVELGTRNMAARPFILPPILARKRDFDRAMSFSRSASLLGGM